MRKMDLFGDGRLTAVARAYRLDSPASRALREGRFNISAKKCEVGQLLNGEIDIKEMSPPRHFTVMGVASIYATIAEDGFEKISATH
jgi:hypothetical protein